MKPPARRFFRFWILDPHEMSELDEIDRRLIRVEAKVDSIERNEARRDTVIENLRERVSDIADDLRELCGSHKVVKWLIGIGIPILLALEFWAVLFP